MSLDEATQKHIALDPHIATQINAAFDFAPVRFHDRSAAITAFRADGREIILDDDGNAHTYYDGEALLLSDALLRFGFDRRDLVDQRTLPRTGAGKARPGIASKADFTTLKEKSDFITTHGFDAYERLPLTGVGSSEVLTQADWYKLPLAEKSRRTAADPLAFSKLAKAPKPESPNQGKTYHERLAKELATKGRR